MTATARAQPGRDWRYDAVCRDEDPELFHPVGSSGPALQQAAEAKSVCRRCPVLDSCRSWALDVLEFGVAGGLTEQERRAIRRGRPVPRRSPSSPLDALSSAARSALLAAGPTDRVDRLTPRPVMSELLRSGLVEESVPTGKRHIVAGVRANQAGRAAIRQWLDANAERVS